MLNVPMASGPSQAASKIGIAGSVRSYDADRQERGFPDSGLVAWPATDELIAQIEAEGGAIAWGMRDGVACTAEQEETDPGPG